jgi:hypothetical protein
MYLHKIQLSLIAITFGLIITGCKEERVEPLPGSGSAIPAPVSNLKVLNLHGGAKISYTVPADPNLLYVEASWVYNGVSRNSKSSYYTDTLTLQGFGDTMACEVKVYSVSRSEKRSNPVSVTVNPLTAPVQEVFKSLTVKPDFGGINVGFRNDTRGDVVISVLTPDSTGRLVTANAFYTNLQRDSFSTRGFDASPRVFGIFVKDRWNNLSDTLYSEQTPFFELLLNKSKFRELNPYPGDVNSNIHSSAYPMNKLWDNNTGSIYVTKQGLGLPQSFTIDLGVSAKLSRMKYFQRMSTAFYFTSGTPEIFDVYGSNNPAPDGNWDSWTLLQHCVSKKPSGLALGLVTNDDIAYAQAGEDFNFPLSVGSYRYLRFKVAKTYGNASNITFSELTFWGAY